MSAKNFNTQNDTYRQLMGNGLTYRVPRFQRDYSWGEDEWEDLWQDIQGTIEEGGEPAHYMGYLVLQSENEKTFDVIDGQQRLTTLSLIVLASLKNLLRLIDEKKDPENNQRRLDQIRQSYIGYLDPVTLVPRSKLSLNRNNNSYYQNYIVPLDKLPQRGFKASEHQLRKAFEWFERRIREYLKTVREAEGVAIASLVETMSDKLFFTVITVTDELNAYKVFETLNSRGVRLSATDLLKNYLFSILHREDEHEHEVKQLEDRWEGIVSRLGSESFPDFLRVHWNSRHNLARQTELFKVIRRNIQNREQAFALIRDMDADVDVYLGLRDPDASNWPEKLKSHAKVLKTFNVRQPYSYLLACHRRFAEGDFQEIFRAVVVVSFRYNVILSAAPGEQERTYSAAAIKIHRGESVTKGEAISLLAPIYPDDNLFKVAFADKSIRTTDARNKRVVRYILCRVEKHITNSDLDFASDSFNLEHVLPQNPENGWEQFNDSQVEAMVYRLGNMTLLSSARNRDIGTAPYEEKREIFRESEYEVTRRIAEHYAEWTPEKIANHQNWLADQATAIWSISQLS
jgi:hypothetical protein